MEVGVAIRKGFLPVLTNKKGLPKNSDNPYVNLKSLSIAPEQ